MEMVAKVAILGATTVAMVAKVALEVAMEMETGAKVAILEAITVAMVGKVAMEVAMVMETGVRMATLEATTAMEVRVGTLEEEVTALEETATTGTTGVKEGLEVATMEMGIVLEGTVTMGTGVREGTLGEAMMETGIVSEGTVTTGTTGVKVETTETTETVLDETAIMETEDRVEIANNIHRGLLLLLLFMKLLQIIM